MTTFRPIMIALVLFGLFAIALINVGILLATVNEANQSIADDPKLKDYAAELNKSIRKYERDVNESEQSIGSTKVNFLVDNIVFKAIAGVWKGLKAVPTTIYNLTADFVGTRLGPQAIIGFGVLATILTLSIIIAVWRLIHTGEGG